MRTGLPLPAKMPLAPLKDTVVFPGATLSVYISREKSKKAVQAALKGSGGMIFLSCLQESLPPGGLEPAGGSPPQKVYKTGCIAFIIKTAAQPDGRIKAAVRGVARATIEKIEEKAFPEVHLKIHAEDSEALPFSQTKISKELEKSSQELKESLNQLAQAEPLYLKFLSIIEPVRDPGLVCDLILSHLDLRARDQQKALEAFDRKERVELTKQVMSNELEIRRLEGKIKRFLSADSAKPKPFPSSPPYGRGGPHGAFAKKEEIIEYSAKIRGADLPQEAKKESLRQLQRLEKMHMESGEASIIRNYLDWILELPWSRQSADNLDLENAKKILDRDHFDLSKVKERILEFLAVRALKPKDSKGPILCFAGPPGVGKTSLGKSIAAAMGRAYQRISLGGVKDEAEIRGHRRTYIGSMPGKIIQALKHCQTMNPVIVLDEIDKLGSDFRGDPSSALLEALDPEQNSSFKDHYLNLNFNLSSVLFITTANMAQNIPAALRDRLEVISITGYTPAEKLQIAKSYLIESELKNSGLPAGHIQFTDDGLKTLINSYTREAGLRNLKREIASIARKTARKFVAGDRGKKTFCKSQVFKFLGSPKFFPEEPIKEPRVGMATGLAWTEAGGAILHVEAVKVKNKKGGLILTGQMKKVMEESAKAALSYVKSYAADVLSLDPLWFEENEIHIHLPEGAVPKDGPSAGVTLAAALISLLTDIPIRNDIAMTGEITLSGRILPVGGIKEKALAALNHGVKTVILPEKNKKDLKDIPKEFKDGLQFIPVSSPDDVFRAALLAPAGILPEKEPSESAAEGGESPAAA